VHLLAVALAGQARRRAEAPVLGTLPSGWRNNSSGPQRANYELDGRSGEVRYRFGRDGLQVAVDGAAVDGAMLDGAALGDVVLHGTRPDPIAPGAPGRTLVDLEIAGIRRVIQVAQAGRTFYVDSALGHSVVTEADRFPDPATLAQAGSLLAPMPGTVVRVEAAVGDLVEAGAVILAIEAMKMEHSIRAPARGIITELPISVGTQVDSGSVLAVLEEEPRD
jgi:propionyl-CoA carboxylase alpha chain